MLTSSLRTCTRGEGQHWDSLSGRKPGAPKHLSSWKADELHGATHLAYLSHKFGFCVRRWGLTLSGSLIGLNQAVAFSTAILLARLLSHAKLLI